MKMISTAKFKRSLKRRLRPYKEMSTKNDTIVASLSKRLFNDDVPDLLNENDSPQVTIIVAS